MVEVLIQMCVLIVCGAAWRVLRPGGIEADQLRLALTSSVYYLFLPAMVLSVLGRATLGMDSLLIALFGMSTILLGIPLARVLCMGRKVSSERMGAAILATAFGNVTFLGLPLLEETLGAWARLIVLEIDFFAFSPLLYTLGAMAARRYGHEPSGAKGKGHGWVNPPLLSAALAVGLNLAGMNIPAWLQPALDLLASAVVPLMLVSLGLGLRFQFHGTAYFSTALAVLLGKLILLPGFGLWLGIELGFGGDQLTALVLESAMPCMTMGLVFCDRYRLDTGFYAMVTTLSTALALISLPVWHHYAAQAASAGAAL